MQQKSKLEEEVKKLEHEKVEKEVEIKEEAKKANEIFEKVKEKYEEEDQKMLIAQQESIKVEAELKNIEKEKEECEDLIRKENNEIIRLNQQIEEDSKFEQNLQKLLTDKEDENFDVQNKEKEIDIEINDLKEQKEERVQEEENKDTEITNQETQIEQQSKDVEALEVELQKVKSTKSASITGMIGSVFEMIGGIMMCQPLTAIHGGAMLANSLASLSGSNEEIEAILKRLNVAKGNLASSKQKYKQQVMLRDECSNKIARLNSQILNNMKFKSLISADSESINSNIQSCSTQIKEKKNKLEERNAKLSEKTSNLSSINEAYNQKKTMHADLIARSDILNSSLNTLTDELKTKATSITKLSTDIAIESKKKWINKFDDQIKEMNKKIVNINNEISLNKPKTNAL